MTPDPEHPKPHPDPDWLAKAADAVRAQRAAENARHHPEPRQSHHQPRRRR